MKMFIIIDKISEIDKIYNDLKYSSLERIILNSYKKYYYNHEKMSIYILNGIIRNINKTYITNRESNKQIRNLKTWLLNKLDNEKELILISKVITLNE